ncbi:hypothetical protein LY90DRAFT_498715 [Neocallimastix californiae]|uniref:RING-type domain-containing protein n=1 Tax=Neocallimastix californiae TaxID=1754190 RepID=A0A1Y2FR58_9FUNG|nr:hypothetical protein LY90DRAFT_498715 [Neocallimastix californiae]|eukprot:ORY86490.1 hypothetical protein LY90DRAFT_498715 [Neocallimastix californiae]
MTIGPLPAGNNQKFVLPNTIIIPAEAIDDIIKQTNEVSIKNNLYRLQEIYGFTDESDAGQVVTNDVNTSIECVICLSEPRNTIVLPCRHLCVCQDCADILCNQSRHDHRSNYLSTPRCPICRQIFHSFLRINMDYFNSTEDIEDKDITEKKNELSKITKGKDGNQTPEKKYDIIATSHMTEEEGEEVEAEAEAEIEEAKIERRKENKEEEEEKRDRKEEEKEREVKVKKDRGEEEEEEEEEEEDEKKKKKKRKKNIIKQFMKILLHLIQSQVV